jgi:hypothetical protein
MTDAETPLDDCVKDSAPATLFWVAAETVTLSCRAETDADTKTPELDDTTLSPCVMLALPKISWVAIADMLLFC